MQQNLLRMMAQVNSSSKALHGIHRHHRHHDPPPFFYPAEPTKQHWRPRNGETVYKTAVFLGSMIIVAMLLLVLICMARWDNIVNLIPVFNSDFRWTRRWITWGRRRPRNSNPNHLERQFSSNHHHHRYDLEASSVDLSSSLSKKNRGNHKRVVDALPVIIYSATNSANCLELGCLVGTECTICLCEFSDGEHVRVLPVCYHGFHVECVDLWLIAQASCPSCRSSLYSRHQQQMQMQQQQPPLPPPLSGSSSMSSSSSSSSSLEATFI